MTGSANGLGTPTLDNEGPIPRSTTCLDWVPVMINPPIPTLASVRTRKRVERLRACAGLADAVAVAVELGVVEGVEVDVAVGVGVGEGV